MLFYIAKHYEVRKESVDVISYRHPITGEIATYDSDQVEDIEDELAIAGFHEVARRSVKRRCAYVSVVDGDGFLRNLDVFLVSISPHPGLWKTLVH